jgi:hypothetical protein
MTFRRSFVAAALALSVACLLSTVFAAQSAQTAATLPTEISDKDFWRMIVDLSEPGGTYPYENFVTNEAQYQEVIPALKVLTKPGGVFIGVGPEQNFTYVSALRSKLAFVVDIRRQNMLELLMYKAIFEQSPDRADFVGRLFSRPRPTGLDAKASVAALFDAYGNIQPDADLLKKNQQAVRASMAKHGFELTAEDLNRIDYICEVFSRGGPRINYAFASTVPANLQGSPTFRQLMNMTDFTGRNSAFLANEEDYQYVREMQRKNLIVPLVGDFAGPAVIRNIGKYVKDRRSTVSVFYISNVETYLDEEQKQVFYQNIAALPTDPTSTLLRHVLGNPARALLPWWRPGMTNVSTVAPMNDLIDLVKAGKRPTFEEQVRATKDYVVQAGLSR